MKVSPTTAEPVAPVSADLFAAEMAAVEERLAAMTRSREPRLEEISSYLIRGGGKRVRPLVTIAVYRACGGDDVRDAVDVAVALELIHTATLLHDDIIDAADTRRGRPSPYRRFGVADTLVTGDFLFSKAFGLCGRFDEQVIEHAAGACVALTEGEILQARFRRNPAVTLEDYEEIIARKTASLFEQGARIAAILAGTAAPVVAAVGRAGRAIGMAFQTIDDLLDVAGDPRQTGKATGADLRDGNPSLPVVLGLARSPAVAAAWTHPEATAIEVSRALEVLRAPDLLEQIRREALASTHAATRELEALPASPYRDYLETVIADLAERAL